MSQGTTPDFDEWLERRASSEERSLSDAAQPEERMMHIRDIIESLDYMAIQQSGWTGREVLSAILWILFLVFVFPAVLVGIVLSLGMPQIYELIAFAVIFVFVVFMVCRIVLKKHGVYSKAIRDRIVEGLAPIDPSVEELNAVLRDLKKCTLAKSIDANDLLMAIDERLNTHDSI